MSALTQGGAPGAPLSRDVTRLLARADAELVAASRATDASDRFRHAHLGALRAAAAVVTLKGRPSTRSRLRTVWQMLSHVEPELARWAQYFEGSAAERAAIDTGRALTTEMSRADELVACAEDFRDEVAMLIDPGARFVVYPLRLVAS
ncbi:hypothetical protein GCM10025865_31530 [Paraoerskovia sediminicola]|uniref:SAV-6107-like HEPN domain-containing protein n=1 Tax=Paraoerskovia sediminicola TaxID=1138587 RepID=A0ABN6XGB8_9CELL|nr:SAV_6107 family HEPN domain-containing protein [Paraoerskovia sediminicola]BDZ43854.1 hypothetical protein GCM10025865_31530 [Paraoerskovia sediminicola]